VFLLPEPSEIQLKQAYDSSYYGEGKNKFGFSVEHFIDFYRRKKASNIAALIPAGSKILDLGCGNGRFLQHMLSFGNFELHGVELPGGSAERASSIKEINLKVGTLNENDFSPEYFDVITLFHVFEHLQKPKETMGLVDRFLRQEGLLVMTFPNIAGWQAKIFKSNWYHLDPPRHLIFFDPDDMIGIMEKQGFTLVRKKWMSFEQNPYGWVQSILNSLCRKREVLYERLKGNSYYSPEYGTINIFFQKMFFVLSFPFFSVFDLVESLFGRSATVKLVFRKNKQ
jgi:SAM-dependent methyltransferase